jgi:monoamine oxidase
MDADVAIVGAGAAGIGAARRLAESGLSAVLIEATARVGGRAFTCAIGGMALDLGCGWLHSADRNAWTRIAQDAGLDVDRRIPAWGKQYRHLGFPLADQAAAREAMAAWGRRIRKAPPASDRAADALDPDGAWNAYLDAVSGYINGAELARISIADYLAYDEASTDQNWRVPAGYGALVSASLPRSVDLRLSAPVQSIMLGSEELTLATPIGAIRARAAILAIPTSVIAADAVRLPPELDAWREAAARLPLGRNEKLFLEIVGQSPFEPETQALGNPHDARTGAYYIRPFGRPVVECFLGGAGAAIVGDEGPAAAFTHAADELASLFGTSVRQCLRPLVASSWGRTTFIGGSYSHALPGHAAARLTLARPFDDRIFFAGEATSAQDFSTAHGAHDSGVRAAEEAIRAFARPGARGQGRGAVKERQK